MKPNDDRDWRWNGRPDRRLPSVRGTSNPEESDVTGADEVDRLPDDREDPASEGNRNG
ncbi:MAG: hypothetical protein RLZZ360_656 [Candidatus Parcubacteria bacterium]